VFLVQFPLLVFVAEHLDAELGARRVEDTQYDLLAKQGRARVDTKVDGAGFRQPHLDSTVLRYTALGDVHTRHDLEACADLVRQHNGRLGNLAQHAVETRAHAEVLLVRFEVNIRGATLDRVEQHFVDEAHHRRILDIVALNVFFFLVDAANVEVFEIEIIVLEIAHARVDGFDGLVDLLLELVLLDDDRVHTQARREFDVVNGLQVGRVGDAKKDALATLDERQHAVLGDEFLVNGANDVNVDLDRVQVEQGNTEFVRGCNCDGARICQLFADEMGNQRDLLFLRNLGGLLQLLLGDDTVLNEAPRQAREIGL